MELTIKVKQPGSKHALIDNKIISVEDIGNFPIAEKLIIAIVQHQVGEYNNKPKEKNLLPFLSDAETTEQIRNGKVSFGSIYNENNADASKATSTALQAFEDGMFALFIDDDEVINLSQAITLNPNTIITFIRLTFLAGSYW